MAVVYRGRDEALERDVAIKVLHPHLAARAEHRRRLAREAKAVARLRHPNILEIYDYAGDDAEDAFLVTEFIQGRTLRAFAQAHPFDPPELAAACVLELAGALAHAHEQGIVHRDLKPDNVMIREDGPAPVVKLMDFGIAQIIDRDERMTVTGSLMGSPAHMAPEIIDGEEADARSDVFSLGTILYWLATGALPFEAPSPGALLKRILEGDYPDPREHRPSVSDELARVIADSLARDRERRIQSAAELRDRLGQALAHEGVEHPSSWLERFLRDPPTASLDLKTALVGTLFERGRQAAAAGQTARALAAFSRVITIAPGTSEAGEAREAIDRIKSRRRWQRHLVLAAAAGAVSLAALGALTLRPEPEPPPLALPAPEPEPSPGPGTAVQPAEIRWVAPSPSPPPARTAAEPTPRVRTTMASQTAPAPPEPEARVGLAIVTSPWAHVYIDGELRGRTPFDAEERVGSHRIELSRDCCEPYVQEVELMPDMPRVEIREKLRPRPAQLQLEVDAPPDTGIMVDDQWRGLLSENHDRPILVHIRPGPDGQPRYDQDVLLRLTREGYQEHRQALRVRAGEVRVVQATLKPRG